MVADPGCPLVVVANRLPFSLKKNPTTGVLERQQSASGLVTVAPMVVEKKGLWVGWSGTYKEDTPLVIPEAKPDDKSPSAGLKSHQVIPLNCEKKLFDKYYTGCCKTTFWPLFHSMPDRAVFQADMWEAYRSVNEEFARLTVEAIKREVAANPKTVPLVWLHDYHVMLAPGYIRAACEELGISIKLAFFLHIPFPPWDIMRLFPWDDELLQGILACDSIGFNIDDYCLNFIDCCKRQLGCRVDRHLMLVESYRHTVGIHKLPISIPYERFNKLATEASQIIRHNSDEQLVLAVDTFDYIKGLRHRLRALETLFEKHPEHIEHVTFLQVAVPSYGDVKDYQELKEDLDRMIGNLNGRFSTPNWSPIRYIFGYISQEQLASYYRESSVCCVTPLRDGMNLVAKEFVACQVKEPGVLILSPFAGAGVTMLESLLVNPYNTREFAETMHRALTMSHDERELRMKQLRRRESENDVNYWLKSFLKSVDCLIDNQEQTEQMEPLSEKDFSQFLGSYVTESSRLALLLDYDGTLAPIAPHLDLAHMPEETRRCLERLSHMSDVHVAVMSSRSLDNLRSMVGIPGITYSGNHGLEIQQPNGTVFRHPVPEEYANKLVVLRQRLLDECCHDGAYVDKAELCLTFHYRPVPKEKQEEITAKALKIFEEVGIPKYQSLMAFEARPPITFDKGQASIYILRTMFGLDWSDRVTVIYAGDRNTDEDAMKALQGMAVTFRITTSNMVKTHATYRLPSTDSVLTMLKWVEKQMGKRAPEPNYSQTRRSASPMPRSISMTVED
ncbi:unnamed protein product [Meganyctiphanes norvegica]|uniref:Uncharacterized protein n=1 Tax=Meganyctiphanes norvegica TaxID=48144 RepID=A0AAV2QR96_MEGNR